ncbi:MAG: sugar phosphate nucleotidyltransferase [Bacillota bacterium]|nr:sugar phosphate nucleotidyltransferase [Bacillota bacterium]
MKTNQKPTLIIMAAGMGSRYGGLKQVDKITEAGEIILDFSLYDAMMAGFSRAIFVIKEEHRELFRQLVDERAGRFMEIDYAYQKLDDIPEGFRIPEGREKPWGTSHAVLACRDLIDGPFAVINADDYYGPGGFSSIYEYLTTHQDGEKYAYCMIAYKLENTITEHGHVARGVCETDDAGFLQEVTERTKIMRRPEGICYTEDDGETWVPLPENTIVSMNFWGFSLSMMDELRRGLPEFLENALKVDPLKGEYLLPRTADKLIKEGKAQIKVLTSQDKWCGVTYKEDKAKVQAELQSKKDKGLYPEKLWK